MNPVPNPGLLPIAETSPAGHATAATHFLREHLPRNAGAEYKENPSEGRPIVHGGSATVRFGFFRR